MLQLLLLLILFLTATPGPAAGPLPPIMGGAPAQRAERDRPPPPLPDPADLQPNWWAYFQVDGSELDRHIVTLSRRLEPLSAQLPAARPYIQRIEDSLDAYAAAKRQPTPTAPIPGPLQDSYTVGELLDLTQRLHTERTRLQAERVDVASSEKTVDAASAAIDTQLAAYLGLSHQDPDRALKGLALMADRMALAVAQEQLRINRAVLRVHEAELAQLETVHAAAIQRLRAAPGDPERLAVELEQARSVLTQARERLAREQSLTLGMLPDNPAEKAALPYRQQLVVNAAVVAALARLRVLALEAQAQLAALLLGQDLDTRSVRRQLADREAELTELRSQAVGWAEASRRERDRAGEALSATGSDRGATPLIGVLYRDRLALAQDTLVALQRLEGGWQQMELLTQLLDVQLARREGGLRDWLARGELTLRALWETAGDWLDRSLFKIGGTPVTALGLLRVALILFLAWWISKIWRRALARLAEHREGPTQSALYTVGRLSHYVLISLGLIIGLASIGVDFTNFALVAGAIGIGIGFGLQSIVSNFVSGLILLFERSLKVGDFVELDSGLTGEVRAINVRSTLINTNDNVDIVVPNSEFMVGRMINWTLQEDYRRIHIAFRTAYSAEVEQVEAAALEAAAALSHTLTTRQPSVWLVDFADNSLIFELVVWITPAAVKRPGAVNADYRRAIHQALRRHGIEVPLPQRELHLKSGFERLWPPPGAAP